MEGMFKREDAEKVACWLKSQDLEALATTWTDREPLVSLAVYQNVHQKDLFSSLFLEVLFQE